MAGRGSGRELAAGESKSVGKGSGADRGENDLIVPIGTAELG